jgi:hypothetical protein
MARAAAVAMRNRTMPPWPMTSDGSCGEYQHSRWMTQSDIATVEAWVAAGMPEGEPQGDLTPPVSPPLIGGTRFSTPHFHPVFEGGHLAAHDEYRCFLIPTQFSQDQFVTGYEVVPGNPALIHHVLVYAVDTLAPSATGISNADQIRQLDRDSPNRAGWPCFGTAGAGVNEKGVPVSWAPGQGATYFPENTGYRIKSTDWLVAQVHYNMSDASLIGQHDETAISLLLKNSVQREGLSLIHI